MAEPPVGKPPTIPPLGNLQKEAKLVAQPDDLSQCFVISGNFYVEQRREGQIDDIPEDWVRIRRLGDGIVGLVPKALLSPVPNTQVNQEVPAHLEERGKPAQEEEDNRDKQSQQPSLEMQADLHTPSGMGSGHAPIPRASQRLAPAEVSRPPALVARPDEGVAKLAASTDWEVAEAASSLRDAASTAGDTDAGTVAIDATMVGNAKATAEDPSPSRQRGRVYEF